MSLTCIEPVDPCCEYSTGISVWMALHHLDRYHLVSSPQFLQGVLPLGNFWDLGRPFEHDVAVKRITFSKCVSEALDCDFEGICRKDIG